MHSFVALSCCSDESAFKSYYPKELKIFCDKILPDDPKMDYHHIRFLPYRRPMDIHPDITGPSVNFKPTHSDLNEDMEGQPLQKQDNLSLNVRVCFLKMNRKKSPF